jgi:hypothetical protein
MSSDETERVSECIVTVSAVTDEQVVCSLYINDFSCNSLETFYLSLLIVIGNNVFMHILRDVRDRSVERSFSNLSWTKHAKYFWMSFVLFLTHVGTVTVFCVQLQPKGIRFMKYGALDTALRI